MIKRNEIEELEYELSGAKILMASRTNILCRTWDEDKAEPIKKQCVKLHYKIENLKSKIYELENNNGITRASRIIHTNA